MIHLILMAEFHCHQLQNSASIGTLTHLCSVLVSMSAAVSPAAATTSPAAPEQLEESVVIQRRTQKPRANGRTSTGKL